MKKLDKPVPQTILENYDECGMCGAATYIAHLHSFDKKFQKNIELVLGAKTGWIVFCEECENMGIVDD